MFVIAIGFRAVPISSRKKRMAPELFMLLL